MSARVARHVSRCALCRAETEAVADSLSYVGEAGPLESSKRLTASLLLAAKAERLGSSSTLDAPEFRARLAWGVVTAAVLGLAVVLSYSVQNGANALGSRQTVSPPRDVQRVNAAVLPFNLKASPGAGAELLTKADGILDREPKSRWEREQQRKIRMQSEHIAAGLKRLDRNPANVRAKEVVDSNITLLLETLTVWYYAERSL
ncbi:MAG TPA: hypothetical protein QF901_07040 [Gammaproteobacteria bacterium]|nr:hypothetical protein [Gammaproteobacteria bacterium]